MKKCNSIFILFLFPTTAFCAAAYGPHSPQYKLHEGILSGNLDIITHSLNSGAQISGATVRLFNTVYNNTQEKILKIEKYKEVNRLSHHERTMHLNNLQGFLKTLTEIRTVLVAQQTEQERLEDKQIKRPRLQ